MTILVNFRWSSILSMQSGSDKHTRLLSLISVRGRLRFVHRNDRVGTGFSRQELQRMQVRWVRSAEPSFYLSLS